MSGNGQEWAPPAGGKPWGPAKDQGTWSPPEDGKAWGGRWRLLRSAPAPASFNMAVDEAILLEVAAGRSPRTLRFYAWQPPAVSIGYFQDMVAEIDEEACRRLGIDRVRRPTGGRAVLHDAEVTYSVALPEQDPIASAGILPSYRILSEGMIHGLRGLGVDAQMVSLGQGRHRQRALSAACFEAPSWYEVVVEGRKVVGSAQTRRYGGLLQHGSILLELDLDKAFRVLRFPSEAARRRAQNRVAASAGDLSSLLGRPASFAEVADAVAQGFQQALDIELVPGELTEGERRLAAWLAEAKYGTDAWNLRRTVPQPVTERIARGLAGGRDPDQAAAQGVRA